MARRRRQNAAFPLRRRAGPARASRLLAFAPLRRRMAARRMAAGRKRADQILALDPAGGYGPRDARGNCQTALADRARLSGTQAGTRARSLRRTRLARLSPPHGALRRGLRIPGLRTESDSPLRRQNPAHPSASPIPGLSTPRIRRSEPNATSKRQSQPSALSWPATSHDDCLAALAARELTYDTVRLSLTWIAGPDARRPRAPSAASSGRGRRDVASHRDGRAPIVLPAERAGRRWRRAQPGARTARDGSNR